MKVENMESSRGNAAPNQFIIRDGKKTYFQSYATVIAVYEGDSVQDKVTIDTNALSYSRTTSKYLYQFLGMNRKEIEQEVKDGTIKVKDLNREELK